MTQRTPTRIARLCAGLAVLLTVVGVSHAHAAEALVIGSPDDDSRVTAQAIIASIRASILDHPWLALSEVNIALQSGADPREPIRQAGKTLQAARDKFKDLLIDDAGALTASALEVYRSKFAYLSDVGQLKRALELMGAVALLRDDNKTATVVIGELAALDPEGRPSSELYNPTMLKKWQSIVQSYRAQKRQSLTVETANGPPATVEIDGRFRGLTPFVAKDFLPGVHYVRVSYPGSIPYGGPITIGKKPVYIAPTLSPADNAKLFESARDVVWRANSEHKNEALGHLASLLPVEYLVLVTTTQRDGAGAAALTPVHAELFSTSKLRVLRSADAALGVRPGSAPPLSRTFLDALLPNSPRLALAGTQPVAGDSDAVITMKQAIAVGLKRVGVDAREIPEVDAACLTDTACMVRTRGDSDGVMMAKVAPAGKDVSVALATYVGTDAVSQLLMNKALRNDTLLSAIADQVSRAFLQLEEIRFTTQVVSTPPPLDHVVQDNTQVTRTIEPPPNLRRTAGIVTASVGVGLTVAGFVVAGIENGVLGDPASTGAQKDSARSLGRVGVIAGSVGLAAVVVGTVLWLTSGGKPADTSSSDGN